MTQETNLGDLVRRDREKAGLTQDQLATRLNEAGDCPVDAHTKKIKIASRTWIAKLEIGSLRRGLPNSVRRWLAKTLNGDISLYQSLPMKLNPKPKKEAFIFGKLNVLPLVKFLAKSDLDKMTLDDLGHFCETYKRCSKIGITLLID